MPKLECNGLKIAYEARGSGEPPFVFAHGWTCDRTSFAPQAEYFARSHRVVSVDLRGHGESDKPEGSYPISGYASDLAELIEQLGLGKPIAVGHSMGGAAVLELAANYPQQVAAIVMVDPAPLSLPPEVSQELEAVAAAIEAGDQEPRRNLVGSFFLPKSDPGIVEKVTTMMIGAPAHVAAPAMRGIANWNGAAAAARCKVPTLHVSPAQPLNPPHLVSELLPQVVNGQTVGAGHFNQLEAADQVSLMIEAFIRHYL